MANHKIWWQCSVDSSHEWQATRSTRLAGGGNCPYCNGNLACPTNNLSITNPTEAAQLHPDRTRLTADKLLATSNRIVWWQCATDNSHEFRETPETFIAEGCPHCPSALVLTDALTAELHPSKN